MGPGRASGAAAAILGLLTWTGAALAAPVPVLVATDGRNECAGRLSEGSTFLYRYTQSIYRAPVSEELERRGGRIRMLRARSPDIRAIEYFRWDAEIRHDAQGYVADAPFYETDRLSIRISPEYGQRIDGDGWSCDLPARFGDAIVTVSPAVRPAVTVRP